MSEYRDSKKLEKYRKQIREFIRNSSYPLLARILIVLLGCIFLLFGILLLFLPGPAFLFIPLGLILLATEFKWAKFLINKVAGFSRSLFRQIRKKRGGI
jgi:uncharacterized membrane protein